MHLELSTHALELLYKSTNFLKHAMFLAEVLRIQWTHFGQYGIQFRAAVAGEFTL